MDVGILALPQMGAAPALDNPPAELSPRLVHCRKHVEIHRVIHPGFGRAMRPLWVLAEEGTFLNHGSFGACPRVVLAAQARIREAMEAQPDQFFRSGIMPGEGVTTLRTAAS